MFDFRRNQFLQALLLIAAVWLVIKLSLVFVTLFMAFILTLLLRPVVMWLHRRHVPKTLAVFVPVVGVAALVALAAYFLLPPLVVQLVQFGRDLPSYIVKVQQLRPFGIQLPAGAITHAIESHLNQLGNALLAIVSNTFKVALEAITVFVVTIYLVGTYDRTKETLLSFVPAQHRVRATDVWARVEKKLVSWLKAQLLLSLTVGVSVWVGSIAIGLPFPGVLGVLAGLLEIVPTLGPILAAIPAILLGLTISVKTALLAFIVQILVHQFENHVLTPWLLGRAVRLHPIVVIISLLVGTVLMGILGALLAVPAALVISAFVDSFRSDLMIRERTGPQ